MFTDDQLVPISALQHWLYCPRQCALIHLDQAWAENYLTADGRVLHVKAHTGPDESRAGIRTTRGMSVRSLRLGLSGQCDVVEFHADGQVLPVEYKRGKLDRCSLLVSNNIAEGFERGTTNELLAFLYIARGSAGETRSMLCFFERRPALKDFKSMISKLKSLAESCSRQVRGWAESLQNSEIPRQRHLTEHRLLARHLRGDLDAYPAFLAR
jgi:four helix bundle protein